MNSDLFFDGKRYISSSRAAKISGYANDYIGQLCRGGKLESKMVGRSWYVSLDSLVLHKNSNSGLGQNRKQRTPKLLTREELVELGISVAPIKEKIYSNFPAPSGESIEIIYETDQAPYLPELKKNLEAQVSKVAPVVFDEPAVTEAHTTSAVPLVPRGFTTIKQKKVLPREKISKRLKVVAATGALLIAFSFVSYFPPLGKHVNKVYSNVVHGLEKSPIGNAFSGIAKSSLVVAAKESTNGAAVGFYRGLRDFIRGARLRVLVFLGGGDLEMVSQEEKKPSQGIVVVPSSSDEKNATIARIKDSFSDQVNINPDADNESGVITPVFRTVSEDEYLYVLVPIKN